MPTTVVHTFVDTFISILEYPVDMFKAHHNTTYQNIKWTTEPERQRGKHIDIWMSAYDGDST